MYTTQERGNKMRKMLDFKFTEDQARTLIDYQTQANDVMAGDWLHTTNNELAYYRASFIELCEALMEIGYKWWKKEEPDTKKVLFELVDALHFVISDHIRYYHKRYRDLDRARAFLTNSFTTIYAPLPERVGRFSGQAGDPNIEELTLQDICDQAIFSYVRDGRSSLPWLCLLIERMQIPVEQVVYYYLAKNTLNKFRNANGQKEGTYVRKWNGKSDNEYLYGFVDHAVAKQEDLSIDEIWQFLETEYSAATA